MDNTLLGACLLHDNCQGGTIHAYLKRLSWGRKSARGDARYDTLLLDGKPIGYTCSYRDGKRPAIDPGMKLAVVYPSHTA